MPDLARFRAKHGEFEEPSLHDATNVLHVDMDAFFVSVELLERPELRGKPVVVGGQPNQRGVVSAASYEARKYGIHSAMPLRTAGRLCPHAVFLDGHHEKYGEWSDRVASILARFSPVIEMVSIDEAYLDLAGTERLHGPPFAAADKLLRAITKETGLPCSGGLASTRLVAKVASDQAKPRGLLWVPAGQEARFLAALPVRKIPGIGEVTERALRALSIETVQQLAAVQKEKLEKIFGQWGTALYRKARGGDAYEFLVDAEPKSISQNHTFGEDTEDTAALEAMLSHLSQKACKRLREAGLTARTLTLTIRYAGFDTHTRSKTLAEPVRLDADAFTVFLSLFREHRDLSRKVRLLGVSLSGLYHGTQQLDLLDAPRREKLEKLTRAADQLRDRFGFRKVQFGGSLRRDDEFCRAAFSGEEILYTGSVSAPAPSPVPSAGQDSGPKKDGIWQRLSEGRQLDELWSQFTADARASYGFYGSDVDWEDVKKLPKWRRPFRIAKQIFLAMLMKLTPARRVLLVIALVLLVVNGMQFQYVEHGNTYTTGVRFEFFAALILLLLLSLELADKVIMKRDLEIAREIQTWLVPAAPPAIPGANVAFATRPQNSVAGDYYDAFYPVAGAAADARLFLVIADVAGKSVPAALLMATFQASLHTIAGEGVPLGEVVHRLNTYACAHSLGGLRFTTAVLAEYDPATRGLTYVNAGHNAPVLRRKDGSIERLETGGVPLGIDPRTSFQMASLQLTSGDALIFYTDGVVEAFNEQGQEFGEERWLAAVRELPPAHAVDSLQFLVKRVDSFVQSTRQSDDITCLVLRCE